jgi:hypothetical protein
MIWFLLGGVVLVLWINFLDGPQVSVPANNYASWRRPLELLIKLAAIGGIWFVGFVLWKIIP